MAGLAGRSLEEQVAAVLGSGAEFGKGGIGASGGGALGVTVVSRAVAMARACLPKLRQDALQLLFAEGLDGEETAGGSGGDGNACEDWTGDTGGRGGELSVRDGSLARPGRLSGLWHTSRPPPIIG